MNKRPNKNFILDCCNSQSSKLKPYESVKDINLAGYFALKHSRNHIRTGKKSNKEMGNYSSKKRIPGLPYVKSNEKLSHSDTSHSLPPIEPRKSHIKPLSKDEFLALISKYRQKPTGL